MKLLTTILLMSVLSAGVTLAQPTELTSSQAKTLYKTVTKKHVSVHDPSVVWEPTSKRYYIFGSHKAGAYTTDMQNWTQSNPRWQVGNNTNAANKDAFVTPAVKKVKKGGVEVDLPPFNAVDWAARTDASYNVDGNMWAPDIIWNPTMQKWCMYMSINGDSWHSSIVLLTADNIAGPYLYQGPVVISGFDSGKHTYKDTDLELVLGAQSSLPSRYSSPWAHTSKPSMPNNIDPCVFYDEEGKLWIAYGSWSGGIFMLELDEETGLRDYDVTYTTSDGDPYFGKRIAGGYYVSGEGPYIEHIGDYYYLFMSYGFFSPDGGYEMRVFRSSKPNGPYKDATGRSAVYSSYAMNYGTGNSDTRGMKLMGAYNNWGFQTVGECAQGHNSVIAAPDGRTYLVYHTKFNNGTAGHQVRSHQLFLNKQGWLVAAPFEYNGETITDTDIATKQLVADTDIAGTYQLLVHKYRMDYEKMEEVTPVEVTLAADGNVTGAYSGTWTVDAGTSYLTIKLGNTTYNGVVIEEQMDEKNIKAIAFTATANSGVSIWGYKMAPQYALAWQLNNQKVPVSTGKTIEENIALDALWQGDPNVTLQWTSSQPAIISDHGRYNPQGLQDDTDVTLTARLSAGNYYWQQQWTVTAKSEANATPTTDLQAGLVAHYGFDNATLANSVNSAQQAELKHNSTTKAPTLEDSDNLRNGNIVHTLFGANKKESYVAIPNPLLGKTLDDGVTIAFWVKRTDDNLWDALLGITDGTARFFMTGNAYMGYNDGPSVNWIDINNPNDIQTGFLTVGEWQFVTLAIKKTGITLYVNGSSKSAKKVNGKLNGETFTTATKFDYSHILNLLATAPQLCLGNGSFWGSADACFDDIFVYEKALDYLSIGALKKVANRVNSFAQTTNGIKEADCQDAAPNAHCYDLQGRRVENPQRGIYIVGGRKVVIK